MDAYVQLTAAGVPTRAAAGLTGVSRATAARRKKAPVTPIISRSVPVNRLSQTERARVLAVLCSEEFIDMAPMQVYATLLDRGIYLCSISTMYRVLAEHNQVRERCRQARHPARKRPELMATGPAQVYCWDITKLPGPTDDAHLNFPRPAN